MTKSALTHPHEVRVKRTDLRQRQRETLHRASGRTVVVISASEKDDEKLLLDRKYFDEMVKRLRSLIETLEIATDQELFGQILRAASTLEKDTRRGKLHSFKEAFGEE
jgi:hypothetical protein